MKSLSELNATPRRYTFSDGRIEETTYAVGGMGRSFSRTRSGVKVHMLTVRTVVGYDEEMAAAYEAEIVAKGYKAPRRWTIGHSSVQAFCNGNGSQTGIRVNGWDTDKVNCKNCGA